VKKDRCSICGVRNRLTIDHIIPKCRGGNNEKDNLRVLCKRCHKQEHIGLMSITQIKKANKRIAVVLDEVK
jgi:5-methylcytosine-specific restriction endonuclease McrA